MMTQYFSRTCQLFWMTSLYPSHNEVVGGDWFHSIRPSVRPSWLDPFHIYTSHQATSECVLCVKFLAKFKNWKFWQYFKICNSDFVWFWLGIWCESLVWVIMGRREGVGGVISERRRSSCSSFICRSDTVYWHLEESISNFPVINVHADVVAPSGARVSARTVMIKFESRIYIGPAFEG